MLLIKKLCRLSGESRRAAHERDQQHNATTLPVGGTVASPLHQQGNRQTASALEQTLRQRFSTLDCSSGERQHCATLCRTPPPVYNSLPATPPPSYTPRRIEYAIESQRQEAEIFPVIEVQELGRVTANVGVQRFEVGEQHLTAEQSNESAIVVAAFQTETETANVQSNFQLQHQQLQQQQHYSFHSYSQQHQHQQQQQQPADQEQHQQHQTQKRQQLQRRRRLHLLQQQQLQQQRFAHNINVSSTDSTSSSSDSELESVNIRRRRQLRRDVYCPDLLNACSLILNQQQSSDSSVGSFTDTPPPLLPVAFNDCSSSDYAEIDELIPRAQHQSNPELYAHLYQNDLQWMSQQRELYTAAASTAINGNHLSGQLNGNFHNQRYQLQEMGQHISLRRPRISLTWVLREQQQQQQQQQQTQQQQEEQAANTTTTATNSATKDEPHANGNATLNDNAPNNNNAPTVKPHQVHNGNQKQQRTEAVPNRLDVTAKRYRVKKLPSSTEPLNGYATTPTAHTAHVAITAAPQKFFSNQNLLDYKDRTARPPSKELLFVCTPQRLPKSHSGDPNDALAMAKKRNEIRKKMANKMAMLQAKNRTGDGAEAPPASLANANGLEKDELKSLKGTYSEPSLIAASEGNHQRRHRHRKRRERNRVPKFGYEIQNVDEFLTKCSLAAPANIPVVLSVASTLYQTRPGGYQMEIPLPLGMVVNAVFKNQNWLYVQTPHAEEGYVMYTCCLPLGILPPAARGNSTSTKPTPCWESNGDIFPRPCGNMTDSEKEIRMRGGTRSDGARTPCGKRNNNNPISNGLEDNAIGKNATQCGEHHLDKLYLRAASQPKLVEKAYAQLRSTKAAVPALSVRSNNDEYVTLQQKSHSQQQQQQQQQHVHKHALAQHKQQQQQQQLQKKSGILNGAYLTNGHNGQHLHPGNLMHQQQQQQQQQQSLGTLTPSLTNGNLHQSLLNAVRRPQGLRQTLVAINTDYAAESITLHKGEIVTLCECRESKDRRQWFYVKTRDGREGYIPAEVAGHGYL